MWGRALQFLYEPFSASQSREMEITESYMLSLMSSAEAYQWDHGDRQSTNVCRIWYRACGANIC